MLVAKVQKIIQIYTTAAIFFSLSYIFFAKPLIVNSTRMLSYNTFGNLSKKGISCQNE